MLPILQPLPSRCGCRTEYEKEQAIFAAMQAELQARKPPARRWAFLRPWRRRAARRAEGLT